MDTIIPRGISIHTSGAKADPKFILQAKHLALTYPRCEVSRQEALDALKERLQPFCKYLIAQENHAPEEEEKEEYGPIKMGIGRTFPLTNKHLHIYIEMEDKVRTRDCRFADILQHHGKYESVKSCKDWITYCTKEDTQVLCNFDWKEFLRGKSAKPSRRAQIANLIVNDRAKLEELVPMYPELLFGYKKLKLDIQEYLNDIYVPHIRHVDAYWYYGPTRLGKSWKALQDTGKFTVTNSQGKAEIEGNFRDVFFKNGQNKWFDGYSGQDIVFIDELPIEAAKWNANYLKQWTDTIPYSPEIKGSRLWARWTKVIVTCQHSIRGFFTDIPGPDLDAIIARFKVVNITIKQF